MTLPLQPCPDATELCLYRRMEELYPLLRRRGFSDAVAYLAVDHVLKAGSRRLKDGRAEAMTSQHRAGWIWQVAYHSALRQAKKELPRSRRSVDDLSDWHAWQMDFETDSTALVRLEDLERLPENEKQAIRLCDLENVSLRDAGIIMGVCYTTVFNYRKRGLSRLREALIARIPDSLHGDYI